MKYSSISEMNDIEEKLCKKLKNDRYKHTIGVAVTAANLAIRYDVSMEKAYLAGLLHDCAKAYSTDKYIDMCTENSISISEYEYQNPQLLHAKLGAHFAKEKYKVDEEEILNAILCHTTGKPNMTMMEKIIFTADYIEPNRNKAKNLSLIRKLAYINIDDAIKVILSDTLEHLKAKNYVIDPQTVKTYEYYIGDEK